jgi:O-antigen biosynthesis protein
MRGWPDGAAVSKGLRASVIIVSRHRAAALARAVCALRQQSAPDIELIVVADPAACAGLAGQGDVKIIPFDQPNISAARNLGIAHAAGDLALFIDDDAVPEPTWAARLIAAFDSADVVAATGFVRGRSGISYQWQACAVDHLGQDHPLDVPQTPSLHQGTRARTVKTQGTNCAFRLSALRAIGGFDPAFAFYLDEADVNLRIAPLGRTMIVPDAQVHHGFLASARRQANRVPVTLFDIAASTAVFLRKHAGPDAELGREGMFAAQTARIASLRASGKVTAVQAQALRESLDAGWQAGMARPCGAAQTFGAAAPFLPLLGAGPRQSVVIFGWVWAQKALHRRAATALAQGQIVTVICLAPSLRRHKMQFLPQGYWWQEGGIWGRSDRDISALFWRGFAARAAKETARIAPYRGLTG